MERTNNIFLPQLKPVSQKLASRADITKKGNPALIRIPSGFPLVIAMVPKGGLDRLSLRDHAIGLCGRARDFRAPKVALILANRSASLARSSPHGRQWLWDKDWLWCRRGDSNPHGFPHHPLKMACLPGSTTSALEEKSWYPPDVRKSSVMNVWRAAAGSMADLRPFQNRRYALSS